VSAVEETIAVEGMTCEGCVRSVTRAVGAVPGVEAVAVDLAGKRATVRYDAARVTAARVREAIRDAGFDTP
jgi:copper chaperone